MLRGWGMLLNLSPVKIPPFLYFIKGASCLWIIRVSLMFWSVETSPTVLSNQRINKTSEGMISSRCFYSALPSSFSSLCVLSRPSGTLTINSLPPALVSDVCSFFISFLDLLLSYRVAAVVVFCCLFHWSNYCQKCRPNVFVYWFLFKSVNFRFSTSSHLQWISQYLFGR